MNPITLGNAKEVNAVVDWTDWSAHENCEHIPNADTIAAFEETAELVKKIRSGEYVRTYDSHAELVSEIMLEMQREDET